MDILLYASDNEFSNITAYGSRPFLHPRFSYSAALVRSCLWCPCPFRGLSALHLSRGNCPPVAPSPPPGPGLRPNCHLCHRASLLPPPVVVPRTPTWTIARLQKDLAACVVPFSRMARKANLYRLYLGSLQSELPAALACADDVASASSFS
ncbi:hypothetical protein AAFF_G00176770 [Aldrovandia affinis]|uniref:Uncharacterized protein n=1 Tax=Aldrovandia affinis TaxID=143900 RepID=A0AAD7W7D3_9TELE|nr:hypothetical protein AAFF_G00176770 [Aldrovandia affinis]